MRTLILAASLLAAGLHAEATKQYVTLDGTRLLKKPAAFAASAGTLKKGTAVWAEEPKAGYVKVKLEGEDAKTGYLNARALQKTKPKSLAGAKKSGDASAEEVAAATKGFNKQVEADMRKDGKSEGSYEKLDTMLQRSTFTEPLGDTESFREKGKLGEFKEGGQ
jgi:hypothetical protein